MNIDNLRKLIKDKKLWVKETTKNIICICPYCGDHKDDRKKDICMLVRILKFQWFIVLLGDVLKD